MFRICLCFVIFLVALADDTNMQAKAKQLEDVFKSNLSPEQKKAKFNEFLTSLGGDYKAKFDSLINELKMKLASSSNEKVKNLGNKLLSQFEAGAFFSGMENARTMITKEIADAKLSEADRAEMKTLKEEFGQKFHSMFQGVLPKVTNDSKTPRIVMEAFPIQPGLVQQSTKPKHEKPNVIDINLDMNH